MVAAEEALKVKDAELFKIVKSEAKARKATVKMTSRAEKAEAVVSALELDKTDLIRDVTLLRSEVMMSRKSYL